MGMNQPGPRVEISIDRIRLRGFKASDGEGVGPAVSRELSRLIETRGLPAGIGTAGEDRTLGAPPLRVAPGTPPSRLGAEVARALYDALDARRGSR